MTHLKQPTHPVYPPNWSQIAREAKIRASWTCQCCGNYSGCDPGPELGVHHIDHNTFNSDPSNLLVLCRVCHLREEAKYRKRLKADLKYNEFQASGQLIFETYAKYVFPQLNIAQDKAPTQRGEPAES